MRLRQLFSEALVSGSLASVTSTLALAGRGKREAVTAAAPVNAISHWFWDDEAFARNETDLRHTLPGYAIHHAMSALWAMPFQASREFTQQPPAVRALGTAALACVIDYTVTPRRLTPGFEKRLSIPSMALVYLTFAAGLWVGDAMIRKKQSRRVQVDARSRGEPS